MPRSFFLFAALAISAVSFSNAGGASSAAPLTPYTAFSWAAPWLGKSPHLSPMIWLSDRQEPGIIARQLAALPPGRRVLFIWHAQNQIWGDHDDAVPATAADVAAGTVPAKTTFQSPWLDHGSAAVAAWFGPWLDGVKKSGTAVDFLVTDAEVDLSMWAILPPQVHAIAADPRFGEIAAKYDLRDISAVGKLDHWDVCSAWNTAMASTIAGYFRAAYYAPLKSRFSDAGYTEYADGILPRALAGRCRDVNGWPNWSMGPMFGTHQSPPIYGQVRQLAYPGRNDGTNPDFAKDPLATLAWETSSMRALPLGSSYPIIPWFCPRSWKGDAAGSAALGGTPYWNELVYHSMLAGGCVDCLFWDPKAPPADVMAMNDVLADLQTQTSNSKTLKPLSTDAIPFNATSIVSGVQCEDGHRLFRITVMPGATSATVTLPGETNPRTIAIPIGQVGVWLKVS